MEKSSIGVDIKRIVLFLLFVLVGVLSTKVNKFAYFTVKVYVAQYEAWHEQYNRKCRNIQQVDIK